jgi:16S rRNA (uracil1498-N3)-methyltransferase
MRIPRIAVDRPLATGDRVALPEATAHHFLRVLRLPTGAEVRLFNGEPGDWLGRLEVRGKRAADVEVTGFEPGDNESALDLTLVQGLSRGQRMDYTLEKAVELGVNRIQPVIMERSQAVPQGERVARKKEHWSGIVAAAAAQSGRTRLPALDPLTSFSDWLAAADPSTSPHVLLDPEAAMGAGSLAPVPAHVTLIAGPEGGFAPAERDAALAKGCLAMHLGRRVLRTETAAVAALAAFQTLYGDF